MIYHNILFKLKESYYQCAQLKEIIVKYTFLKLTVNSVNFLTCFYTLDLFKQFVNIKMY